MKLIVIKFVYNVIYYGWKINWKFVFCWYIENFINLWRGISFGRNNENKIKLEWIKII